MSRRTQRDEVAAVLRERLLAADRDIVPPAGLWERVGAPAVTARPPEQRRRPRPFAGLGLTLRVAALALGVGAIVAGAWWLTARPAAGPATGPAAPAATSAVPLTVYNAEAACRPLRTLECALRLAADPHAPYAAPDNTVGRVWHGDRVSGSCVVTDGTLVQDESGVTSTRWYLVRTVGGATGWLPGVRTRNTVDIPVCGATEAALR